MTEIETVSVMIDPPSYIQGKAEEPIYIPWFRESAAGEPLKLPASLEVGSIICLRVLSAEPEKRFRLWKIVSGKKDTADKPKQLAAKPLKEKADIQVARTTIDIEMGSTPRSKLTLPLYDQKRDYHMHSTTFLQLWEIKDIPGVEVAILTPEALRIARSKYELKVSA